MGTDPKEYKTELVALRTRAQNRCSLARDAGKSVRVQECRIIQPLIDALIAAHANPINASRRPDGEKYYVYVCVFSRAV